MAVSYIGYEVDTEDIERAIDEMEDALHLESDELVEIAQRAALFIRERTSQGIDYEGRPFDAYAESYAQVRDEAGRNIFPVDLTFEGNMLAAMTAFASGGDAIVGFTSAAEARKAQWHNEGTKHMPQRRFLDVDEDGSEAFVLANMAAEFMAQHIEAL